MPTFEDDAIDFGFGTVATNGPPAQVLHQQAIDERNDQLWVPDNEMEWLEFDVCVRSHRVVVSWRASFFTK